MKPSFILIALRGHLNQVMQMLLCLIVLISCGEKRGIKTIDNSAGDYQIKQAKRLEIERGLYYTRVTIINPWQGADHVNMTYYLVKRGSELPAGIDMAKVITVPVEKIVCMSTTHVAMISALGEENTIAGMSGTGFIYSAVLNSRAKEGLINDVGYEANLNKEMILKIKPDITMIYGVGSESSGYVGKIEELGIKVIYNADYLETDPLGKAEWIKLFGALYCREKMADSIYNAEVLAYNNLKAYIAEKIVSKPRVLLGLPFRDTWFISPGNSFVSRLISDAGGEYLWKDTESSVSMPVGLENVYLKALNADYWLNIGTVRTKSEIPAVDKRLSELPCFRNGKLFNNNSRLTVHPHLILNDIASILHPDLFPGNKLFYYREIY
jgi:iron complex transport system substrate-binding protein